MRKYEIGEPMSDEDSLAHYGVKGMKWGRRNKSNSPVPFGARTSLNAGMKVGKKIHDYRNKPDSSGVTRRQAKLEVRKENRDLSRRIEGFERSANRSNQIRSARATRSEAQRKFKDIKDEVKAQKSSGVMGKNAARVVMNKARNERYEAFHKADSKTAGEQLMEQIFGFAANPGLR